jgi:hypothetical protein
MSKRTVAPDGSTNKARSRAGTSPDAVVIYLDVYLDVFRFASRPDHARALKVATNPSADTLEYATRSMATRRSVRRYRGRTRHRAEVIQLNTTKAVTP